MVNNWRRCRHSGGHEGKTARLRYMSLPKRRRSFYGRNDVRGDWLKSSSVPSMPQRRGLLCRFGEFADAVMRKSSDSALGKILTRLGTARF